MSTSIGNRSQAVAAWTRLVRIYQKIDRLSDRNFHDLGLSTASFDVLARISTREGLTQNELAESLLVTKGNVSQWIKKLESEGLVSRQQDGKFQRLHLTPQGKALAKVAVPRQEALLAATLFALSPDEQTELRRLLKKWEAS